MANEAFLLREATAVDLPALARIDDSFSNEWVLAIDRQGGVVEQDIELRWERTEPRGSRRNLAFDEEEYRRAERVVAAEREGRIVGTVMLATAWNTTAAILWIAVDVAYRGQGLGRRFVEEAEAYARERGLRAIQWETQTDNRAAIEFALAHGFRIAGFHDAFYRNDDLSRQIARDFRGIALFLTKAME